MNDPVIKKRKPVLAALLSLLAPGLGQLYNGQWSKTLIAVIAAEILIAVNNYLLVATYPGLLTTYCLNAVFNIAFAVEAYRSAKKATEFVPRSFNRVGFYALFVVLAGALSLANSKISMIVGHEMYQVPMVSMAPTIQEGDRIMVGKRLTIHIDHNDLLVFRSPYDGKTLIKRCVALGNDTVEIRHKALWVNGKQVVEKYVKHDDNTEYPLPTAVIDRMQFQQYWEQGKLDQTNWVRDNFGPVVVPAGYLFTLGDNRDNSFDSRFWGPLDQSAVIGKPLYIYFSKDHKRIGATLR
jgi:signal peptidase I